jgi:hypothetical protein
VAFFVAQTFTVTAFQGFLQLKSINTIVGLIIRTISTKVPKDEFPS